jgi:hypothetical protein
MGESLTAQDTQHLVTCVSCQTELDEITAIVTAARSITPDDLPTAPSGRVWEAIAAEALGRPAPTPAAAPITGAASGRTRHRQERWWNRVQWPGMLVGATAAVAVFAVGGVVATNALRGESAEVISATELAPLPAQTASGTASVVTANGGRELTLDVADMPQTDSAYFEVWLLAEDVSRMVSLGTMDGPNATLPIPAGVDLADYPVVDVSIEPFDGDPTHSSDSLVRGTLSV